MSPNQNSFVNSCEHFRERKKNREITQDEIDMCILKGLSKMCPETGRINCWYDGVVVVFKPERGRIDLITCYRAPFPVPTPKKAKYSTKNDKYSTRKGKPLKVPKREKRTGKAMWLLDLQRQNT